MQYCDLCFKDDYSKYRRICIIEQKKELFCCLRTLPNELSTAGHTVKMPLCYSDISDSVQTVYELPLLPNYTAVQHCYTNREG